MEETINSKQSISSKNALLISGLSKKYFGNNNFAINNLSFKVGPGEFHGFIGANGAGKTTTIKSIIGAYARFKGEITIFGHKHSSSKAKERIGYIPEVANFPKELSARQYLKKMAILSGYPSKLADQFAVEQLVAFGIDKLARRNPNRFSSGQKKKLLLAQALIGNPDLIIMDEPAANLDPQARKDFFGVLKKLQKQGKSIFISSHILVEMAQYIDNVTIIDHGKLLYSGPISAILKKDENKFIFKFKDATSQTSFVKSMTTKSYDFIILNNKEVAVKINSQADLRTLFQEIVASKLKIEHVKEDLKSLQDVYDYFVSKGQVGGTDVT